MAEAQRLLCAAHRRLHVRDIAPCDLHDDCENRHGVFWRHVVLEKHPCQGDAEAVLLGRGPRACYHDGHGRVLHRAVELVWVVDPADLTTRFAEPNRFAGDVAAARRNAEGVHPRPCQPAQLNEAPAVTPHVLARAKGLGNQVVRMRLRLTGAPISPAGVWQQAACDAASRMGRREQGDVVEEPTGRGLRAVEDPYIIGTAKHRRVHAVPRLTPAPQPPSRVTVPDRRTRQAAGREEGDRLGDGDGTRRDTIWLRRTAR